MYSTVGFIITSTVYCILYTATLQLPAITVQYCTVGVQSSRTIAISVPVAKRMI